MTGDANPPRGEEQGERDSLRREILTHLTKSLIKYSLKQDDNYHDTLCMHVLERLFIYRRLSTLRMHIFSTILQNKS